MFKLFYLIILVMGTEISVATLIDKILDKKNKKK